MKTIQYKKSNKKRYRLDTAANLYPAIHGRKSPGVFRVSATLTKPVQSDLLQRALNITLKRIPGFSVNLRTGFLWHYFEHTSDRLPIQKGLSKICTHFSPRQNNGFLIRVMYQDHRIALEVFHSVADGAGAIIFLKTLIAQYLNLLGYSIPPSEGILNCNKPPHPSEIEDSFHKFAGNSTTRKYPRVRAYQIKGTLFQPPDLKTITGTIPIKALRLETSRYGASFTEYITAAYLLILKNIQLSENPLHLLPIQIQVPINLRNFHETKTLRNFSAFISPGIDPERGEYSFEEIIKLVHHFMRIEITKKNLRAQVAANVRYVNNPLVKMIPLCIKNRIINLVYKFIGPNSFTSTISNIGNINVPVEMSTHVKRFTCTLAATQYNFVSCSMLGYMGNILLNFSRVIEETNVERKFFSFLKDQGLPVAVEGII